MTLQPFIHGKRLKLSQKITTRDLYTQEGLRAIDARFIAFVGEMDSKIVERLLDLRLKSGGDSKAESEMILELAPFLERFLLDLFMLPAAQQLEDLRRLYSVKRHFVQRVLLKERQEDPLPSPEILDALMHDFLGAPFDENLFVSKAYPFMGEMSPNPELMKFLVEYAHFATKTEAGRSRHQHHILFKFPEKVDFEHLVPAVDILTQDIPRKQGNHPRARDGFNLVDPGLNEREAFDAASYCIKCGPQGKDSCSKGLKDGAGTVKTNPLGNDLTGCPLGQKISEMMTLYEGGQLLGALSTIMIDNPLLALTGHRICNDCMKACIFQKQDPVDVPGVESAILKKVLRLPYGFEIYSLLTRWNPLKFRDVFPSKRSTHSVLVVGLGPAGIALSYYLTRQGIRVVGIDGTKIEPPDSRWVGETRSLDFELLESTDVLFDDLEKRVIDGFGGVMEYGITARWDKNVLAVMRLILERTPHFQLYDGIRYGGTLGALDANALGFDHVALCVGAGAPKTVPIKNNFSKGVRFAADFLMSLQLTGAYKRDALVNYDVELPLVVIGAGLTAIDAATEALAYYPRLVERFQSTYETLVGKLGVETIQSCWTEDERIRAERYLSHAQELSIERLNARNEDRAPNFLPLLNTWGGVTLLCRTPLTHTQSYKLNHLEIRSALMEGIQIVDGFSPTEFELDVNHHVTAVHGVFQNGQRALIPARTVLMATGTGSHTLLEEEQSASPDFSSFWGDCNPSYAGSVVKAIANVKDHHGALVERLRLKKSSSSADDALFFQTLDQVLKAQVHDIRSIASGITELVIKAPLAARNSKPGQFFKVQPYARSQDKDEMRIGKSVALSRSWVDEEKGLIGFIVLEGGVSTMLIRSLKLGAPIHIMGPTGTPTEIDAHKTVLMIGGGLGNAVLFSVGQALRAAGSRVIYVAAYKHEDAIFKPEEIENAADSVIWAVEEGDSFKPRRAQDALVKGNCLNALQSIVLGDAMALIKRQDIEKVLVIGSEGMIWAIKTFLSEPRPYFPKLSSVVAGVNSPMQCMMKGICGQCIQKHVDPKSLKESFVFSCKNQDQSLESLDVFFLATRLSQNRTSEKLQTLYLTKKDG